MFKEFKDFISRGNVMDLAIAVVIGTAFTAVITAFANGVLMNIVAAIFGKPNFDALTFSIGKGVIEYGNFLTAMVNFLIVAVALFIVVKALNTMQGFRKRDEEEAEAEKTEIELLTEIRDALVNRD